MMNCAIWWSLEGLQGDGLDICTSIKQEYNTYNFKVKTSTGLAKRATMTAHVH